MINEMILHNPIKILIRMIISKRSISRKYRFSIPTSNPLLKVLLNLYDLMLIGLLVLYALQIAYQLFSMGL